jgi:hypothetical protein
MLAAITNDSDAPSNITRIYDSGFAPNELSVSLHERDMPDPELQIVSTGIDIQKFLEMKLEKEVDHWLPYLVVELAPYDDSLLRQVRNQPAEDPSGLFRLPTGEVIVMALQLLDVMDYLYSKHRRAYIDWKPEHIFWSGLNRHVKLVDWNVTTPLDENPGERQNIRDDLRLFCGAVLYIGLTFVDSDDPSRPIGSRPTTEFQSPVSQIRRRYWTDNPEFHQRNATLDNGIKYIIQKGLDPKQGFNSTQELKRSLMEYAFQELGLDADFSPNSNSSDPYFKAIFEVRQAQQQLLQAQEHLIEATENKGTSLEFTRMFDVIKRALMNFPAS